MRCNDAFAMRQCLRLCVTGKIELEQRMIQMYGAGE
jgi:hypothetical protein